MILGVFLAGWFFFSFLVSSVQATKIYLYEDPETGEKYYSNIPLNEKFKVYMKLPSKKNAFKRENGFNYSAFSSAYEKIFEEVAKKYELDPALLKAIAKVESNFNPRAVSPKGAMGIMQLIPSTARLVGVSDPFDPVENIHGGARYLKRLLEEFGDLRLSLAAYNAGPEAVRQYGGIPPYPETINYVRNVLEYYRYLKKENL